MGATARTVAALRAAGVSDAATAAAGSSHRMGATLTASRGAPRTANRPSSIPRAGAAANTQAGPSQAAFKSSGSALPVRVQRTRRLRDIVARLEDSEGTTCTSCKTLLPTAEFQVGKQLRKKCSKCRAAKNGTKLKDAATAAPAGSK